MQVSFRVFWLPKSGNSLEEYEDSFFPQPLDNECEYEEAKLQFAVADGASEGMLSGHWANILTRTFCSSKATFPDILDICQIAGEDWSNWLTEYRLYRALNKPIQWFEEPGLDRGAFSSLLGFILEDENSTGKWQATAIGDSCLFQIRGDKMLTSFPISASNEFNNRPFLIGTSSIYNKNLSDHVLIANGSWFPDDRFYMMTDALAEWFLREYEEENTPWEFLRDLGTDSQIMSFEEKVNSLREKKHIRNDDVTLLRIDIN